MPARGLLTKIKKFKNLPAIKRALLIEAFFLMMAIRVGLMVFPFFKLRSWVKRHLSRRAHPYAGVEASQIAWSVQVAGRMIPRASECLVQAFVGEILCRRFGVSVDLKLGVLRDQHNLFRAHAWLENGEGVILDGLKNNRYTPLPFQESENW